MIKTYSFIPFQDEVTGSRIWALEPNAIEGWVEKQSLVGRPIEHIELREKSTAGLCEWQRKKIIRFIDDNIDTKLRVADLSELVRLSVSRFSKAFNVTFGRPPYDYVLSRRVEAAKYLITSTGEPLSQVAHACGLSDQAHLSKVFKRIVGTTPLKYRKSAKPLKAGQWDYLAVGRAAAASASRSTSPTL